MGQWAARTICNHQGCIAKRHNHIAALRIQISAPNPNAFQPFIFTECRHVPAFLLLDPKLNGPHNIWVDALDAFCDHTQLKFLDLTRRGFRQLKKHNPLWAFEPCNTAACMRDNIGFIGDSAFF